MTTIWKAPWYKPSQTALFFLIGIILFTYIAIRITTVCISDDEYMTFSLFSQQSWWDVLVSNSPRPDWEPNNHVLNTLFMKLEMLVFGKKDWALRLHSLFAFGLFYYYSCKLAKLFTPSVNRQLCYIVILLLHQYLLDFFGLARGYAISMAGITAALYYYARYLQSLSITTIYKICIALFLAIWANFSVVYFILFFLPMLVVYSYKNNTKTVFYKQLYVLYLFCTMVLITCGMPMYKTLQSTDLFGGQTGIFQDCIVGFVNQAISHDGHINRHVVFKNNWRLIEVIGAALLLFWIGLQIACKMLNTNYSLKKFHTTVLFFLLFCAILFKILHVLNQTPIPTNRTLLIFAIPFFCTVCLALEQLVLQHNYYKYLLYTCCFCIIAHFYFCINFINTVEWWQNGDAKKLTACIANNIGTVSHAKHITIGAENWQFHSLAFYVETQLDTNFQIVWTDLTGNRNFNYLVVPNNKINLVDSQYTLLQQFTKSSVYYNILP
jgi:hypothetical protein